MIVLTMKMTNTILTIRITKAMLTMIVTQTVLTMKITKSMLTMKIRKTMLTKSMLTKRIIVMTILRRHSSAHRRRSSSNLLQSQAPVTASPVRMKIHISCVSECVDDEDVDDEDVDDDKVLPAWWVCTKLPWPLFPTFEVLQTSNSSSSLSPIIMMTILFITAGEIRP